MKKKLKSNLFIGVLSGTSADSIDAGLFKIDKKISFLNFASTKYDEKLKDAILDISRNKKLPSKGVLKDIDNKVGEISAKTINKLIKKTPFKASEICAIGSHGQTLMHKRQGRKTFSLQVGDPFLIGRETNITTVSNFRQANIKNGGQGAPLTPSFHKEFFKSSTEDRLIINIGGISNMTFLPKNGNSYGWDCGPGNCMIDNFIQKNSDKKYQFDKDGQLASKGDIYPYEIEIDKYLKSKLFQFELPNSYSIENFDLEKFQIKLGKASSADQAACLTEITARSICKSIENFCPIKKASVYLCGGGAENKFLVSRLKILLGSSFPMKNINTLGLEPKYIEAATFAWLAKKRLIGEKIYLKLSTGAKPSLLGEINKN